MRGVRCAAVLLLIAGCSFDSAAPDGTLGGGGGADAAFAPPPPESLHLRVSVLIDGRSRLILSGSQLRWFHLDYAAPGRLGTADDEHEMSPTVIDGAEWWPTWPDDPDSENRDCGCSTLDAWSLAVAVPQTQTTATVTPVGEMRGVAQVVEQATVANDFAVVVELDDNETAGGATYTVDIAVTGT